jgi:type VI secretion system secreted protein VgrG
MSLLEALSGSRLVLSFASGESSLSVRSFRVREACSEPFRIEIVARSPSADLDFEGLVGQAAAFRLQAGMAGALGAARTWTGVCARCEQIRVETSGLSTYEITLLPQLWLLDRRRNHRLFQHQSVVDIAETLLAEWNVEHDVRLERRSHPPLELRIQYGETDYAFLSRLLEEAGISFTFASDPERGTVVVLSDALHTADPRPGGPLPFADRVEPLEAVGLEYVTAVRVRREVRPARLVLRDFDFRNPRFELVAQASVPAGLEERLEQFHYVPGAFLTEGHAPGDTPVADDSGVARHHGRAGTELATRMLEAGRVQRRGVTFQTNAWDLAPGTVFSMAQHPRSELGEDHMLLVTRTEIRGEHDERWVAEGTAVFADVPYRPAAVTPKPRLHGVQSAIVVGPKDETVHTDEFGRVRVQFHWDRQGHFDPKSSCWMRVSQAWAGEGYGLFNLPRVGHEVLVGFVEGDPDQPVVVGRVFNGAQQMPYKLPASKLMSGWKTDSNSNIILFDDTPGEEVFYEQAERDRVGIVKHDEKYMTGFRRTTVIGLHESTLVRANATRVAQMKHETFGGIANSHKAVFGFKVKAGLSAKIRAGHKFEASVRPLVPFITTLMDFITAKKAIAAALPNGATPDLQQVLPAWAHGKAALDAPAAAVPLEKSPEEIKQALGEALTVLSGAVTQWDPEEIEALAEATDLEHALDQMLSTLRDKGGEQAVTALASAQGLFAHLQALLDGAGPDGLPAPSLSPKAVQKAGQSQSLGAKMFEKLVEAILEEVLPKTKIVLHYNKVVISTDQASIELDRKNIKLKAKGDIEIEADGEVKITGSAVTIDPSPCACG